MTPAVISLDANDVTQMTWHVKYPLVIAQPERESFLSLKLSSAHSVNEVVDVYRITVCHLFQRVEFLEL